jgi:hypothetical protein
MIISFILGGLGNQLFQYAAGRQLAYKHGVPLKVETFGYRLPKYSHHPYLLDKFNIAADRARPLDYVSLAARVLTGPVVAWESSKVNILHLRSHALLVGYWQNAEYFKDIEKLLHKEITLKNPSSAATRELAQRILCTEAVSIHVRRTDYVNNPQNSAIFAECSLDYYRDAINVIAGRLSSPHFFVFSDDPAWARESLHSDFPMTFVTHNSARMAEEDLILMKQCKHHIIANSTFSWWGAWLNSYPGKIVIAPLRWYKDDHWNNRDLLPAEWIRL